jgi:hypothetical protein
MLATSAGIEDAATMGLMLHVTEVIKCHLGVRCGGAGRVRRPSGLPSIADILLPCREPPQWAITGNDTVSLRTLADQAMSTQIARRSPFENGRFEATARMRR